MQQPLRVAAPVGLRRLLRKDWKEDKLYPRGTGPMASSSRNVDLEVGDADSYDGEKTAPWYRLKAWRTSTFVFCEALVILGLLATLAGVRAHCGIDSPQSYPSAHVGPRVTFLSGQEPMQLNHLVMVPCHGVTVTESLEGADSRDADWFLLDYQQGKDVPRALVGHIRGALDELDADENALLLFSGGKTRAPAGPKSEGESYFYVADHYDWWGKPDLRARTSTEDFARDSFENIMFSICRFKEVTGAYPEKITIVGYDFKEYRFETLHMPSLRFPPEAFRYVGLHPEGRFDHAAAADGERTTAIQPYQLDPYGCMAGGSLAKKRRERDPFHRTPPYSLVCPEMSELLEWCEPDIFMGDLPWSPVDEDRGPGDKPGVR